MALKRGVLLLLLITLASLCACSANAAGTAAGTINIRTVITRDFGKELLLDKTLDLPEKSSAMEALNGVARVDTGYGGVHQSVPAVIGHFPQPFKQGYAGKVRPTIIVFSDDFKDQAASLKKHFTDSGIQNVRLTGTGGLSEKEKQESNLVLLALPDNALTSELNKNWRRLGFFACFEQGTIVTLNAEGKKTQKYGPGTGWIQATQNPWNPNGTGADENVVWLLTGTDKAGVQAAADSLINRYAELKYACTAVVAGDEIIRLPQ
jgi:hypothetical protein